MSRTSDVRVLRMAWGIYLLGLVVLVAGALVTFLLWHYSAVSAFNRRDALFSHYVEQADASLQGRILGYTMLVRAGQGVFDASDSVERMEWRAFVHSVDLPHSYPGIQSLFFIQYVPKARLTAFLHHTRNDHAPGFTLHPAGTRDFYCPLTYNEPESHNSELLGFDACTSPGGRLVLMQARDTGAMSLSAPVTLSNGNGKVHRGVVLVVPVYRKHVPLDTVEERRSGLLGWVGVTLPVSLIMAGIVPEQATLALQVYDNTTQGITLPLYDLGAAAKGGSASRAATTDTDSQDLFPVKLHDRRQVLLNIGGRSWLLKFHNLGQQSSGPAAIAVAGMLITLLLMLVLVSLGRTRHNAVMLARRITLELQDKQQLLSSITNNISDGIYRSATEAGLIYVNDALVRMFGCQTADDLMGIPGPALYVNPERRLELQALLQKDYEYHDEEVEFQRKDGTRFFGLNSAVAIRNASGEVLYFDGVISDITARKQAERQVYTLAHYDALTGLPNRGLFRDRLAQGLASAERHGGKLAVMFLDLDRFKNVNDSLGHETGDHLLQAVGKRLLECVRRNDCVSRQGGDEFILMVHGVGDRATAARIADKIMAAVGGNYSIGPHELNVTPSIGISLFPEDGVEVETLIRNADIAMYQAKENGRANYQFFTYEMTRRTHERLSLETELRHALEREEFSLVYQPQVSLCNGMIAGVEALLRWHSRSLGEISPTQFIPVAEQSGLILPIGEWVLRTACRQNRAWQEQGLAAIPVAVNLSAIQFLRNDMAGTIAAVLEETGLAPSMLELELTESVIMQDTRETALILRRLDQLGVSISVDDFGTGYSSLSYLKRFRIDKIKIDQSFVRDIASDPDDAAIIHAVIGLGSSLNLKVVAEGAETAEQLEFLRRCRCDLIQGYHFSKPLPAGEFAQLLRQGQGFMPGHTPAEITADA